MKQSQEQVVFEHEGDSWFERNKTVLNRDHLRHDQPLLLLDLYKLQPQKVLEVGCSNGYRLAEIAERYPCRVVGVEPSAAAIADGRERFPNVEFVQGVANAIPLHETFDLIIVNFVFYIVDRARILQTVGEIDRLLADGGLLIMGDFFPATPQKVDYHHLPQGEFFTFKQDYGAVFLASGIYHPISLLTGSHGNLTLSVEPQEQERIGTWLLRKSLNSLYTHRQFVTGS